MADHTGILSNIVRDFQAGSSPPEIVFKYRVNMNQIRIWATELDKNSVLYKQVQRFLSTARLHLLGRLPGGATATVTTPTPPPPPPPPSGDNTLTSTCETAPLWEGTLTGCVEVEGFSEDSPPPYWFSFVQPANTDVEITGIQTGFMIVYNGDCEGLIEVTDGVSPVIVPQDSSERTLLVMILAGADGEMCATVTEV